MRPTQKQINAERRRAWKVERALHAPNVVWPGDRVEVIATALATVRLQSQRTPTIEHKKGAEE